MWPSFGLKSKKECKLDTYSYSIWPIFFYCPTKEKVHTSGCPNKQYESCCYFHFNELRIVQNHFKPFQSKSAWGSDEWASNIFEEWWVSKQVSEWAGNIWGVMTERAIYDPIMECASVQGWVNKAQLNSIKQMTLIFEDL